MVYDSVESLLGVCHYFVVIKVRHDVAVKDVFQYLASDRCWWYWSVHCT